MGRTARLLLVLIPALAILVGLGTWQLYRLGWKQDLIATMDQQLAAEPADLPGGDLDLDQWVFRPVRVAGQFIPDSDFEFPARTFDGQVGKDVLTAFRRTDGPIVMVHRGWVPADGVYGPATSEGAIEAVVREAWPKTLFRPENDLVQNQWFWMDMPAMAAVLAVDRVAPYYLSLKPPAEGGSLPKPRPSKLDIPNRHLEYAITWYALAGTLLVIAVTYLRRP